MTSTLRLSAAAGDPRARFAFADHYYRGLGAPQNYSQALLWYSKSANQGFAPAQTQLGSMYQHKWGVPRDYKRALARCSRMVWAPSVITSKPLTGTAKRPTRISGRRKSRSANFTSAVMG